MHAGEASARVALARDALARDALARDALHARCVVRRTDHQAACSEDNTHTDGAGGFFSRTRRGGVGHRRRRHVAGAHPALCAQEAGWRKDRRRDPDGTQVRRVAGPALAAPPSVDFCGLPQRAVARAWGRPARRSAIRYRGCGPATGSVPRLDGGRPAANGGAPRRRRRSRRRRWRTWGNPSVVRPETARRPEYQPRLLNYGAETQRQKSNPWYRMPARAGRPSRPRSRARHAGRSLLRLHAGRPGRHRPRGLHLTGFGAPARTARR